MNTAVIVSTYNSPESLRKTLLGLLAQSERQFQVVVADDGSGPETRQVLESEAFAKLNLRHVWQPDNGWRKPRALNLAVSQCDAEYVIFLDGDTIPRADFVESHLRLRRRRTYISGARVDVSEQAHRRFSDEDILSNRVFDVAFLSELDPALARKKRRLHAGRWAPLLDLLTYRYAVFMGCNASAWRQDLLAINGFDESFSYGSEDRELGMRLTNSGCRSRWLKFSLVQLHLQHPVNPRREQMAHNRQRFRRLFFTRQVRVEPGLDSVQERVQAELAQLPHSTSKS